jgi:hypothetical protein
MRVDGQVLDGGHGGTYRELSDVDIGVAEFAVFARNRNTVRVNAGAGETVAPIETGLVPTFPKALERFEGDDARQAIDDDKRCLRRRQEYIKPTQRIPHGSL